MPESISFLNYYKDIKDPRQSTKVLYPMNEMLLLCLCGTLAGAEGFAGIVDYGEQKLEFLRSLLPFKNGIPSHDAMNDLFRNLDHEAFEKCFISWVEGLKENIPDIVAIDGKTLCGSRDGKNRALHIVSAWACEQRMVLGQVKTNKKSNEITAIPELLDMLVLKGAIITIDAMGCQKSIAKTILNKEADYILALKGNQGELYDDVKTFFEGEEGQELPAFVTNDGEHGRIETRSYKICDNIDWLRKRHPAWEGLKSIGMVNSRVETKGSDGRVSSETRFYISSLSSDVALFARGVRGHWGIENNLHWVLDVVFDEDRCRTRKDNAPHILTVFKRSAINIINKNKGKRSIKSIIRRAGWGDNTMRSLITSDGKL